MNIILASNSPRRKEILNMIGLDFKTIPSKCDENTKLTHPSDIVKELAARKGLSVKKQQNISDNDLIISCDTIVVLNGKILGKPEDRDEAKKMLTSLSNSSHSVLSGLCLVYKGQTFTNYEETTVKFKELSASEIEYYLNTNEPYDKAGAYAVQGLASMFIEKIEGNYFNVVGLPTNLLYNMFCDIGIEKLLIK